MSKISLILPLFFILFLKSFSIAAATDYDLCNWLGSYYVTYDQCVSSLSPNPLSRTADYQTLASISINLTISNATGVQSKFQDFSSKKNSDPTTSALLDKCFLLYERNITSLKSAVEDVEAKEYERAGDKVFTFSSMPDDCDEEFRAKKGVASPLMKENLGVMNVALVAHAINDFVAKYK